MERQDVNPADLRKLQDQLLLAFVDHPTERRFTIVSTYPDRSPGSMRDLAAFDFKDVYRFKREAGDRRELRKYQFNFRANDEVRAYEFEDVQTRGGDFGCRRVRQWFGFGFGAIAFDYRSFEIHRRGSRIVEVKKNDFIYYDAVSGEKFDFYNPFPDLLREGS